MNNLYKLYKYIFELYPNLAYKFKLHKYEHVLYTIIYFNTEANLNSDTNDDNIVLKTSMNLKANYINPAKFLLWIKYCENN